MAGGDFPLIVPPRIARNEIARLLEVSRVVLVAGTGLTGRAAIRYFTSLGKEVIAVDEREVSLEIPVFRPPYQDVFQLKRADFAMISPGVPPGGALVKPLWELGVRSLSELDLLGVVDRDPLVGVTGTNGKSTTTTLISEMLQSAGVTNELVGNIGTPFVELLGDSSRGGERRYVAEISSYQLEYASEVRPKVAVLLNLAENHLERHKTMEEYLAAKLRIFAHQERDSFSVVPTDDPRTEAIREAARGAVLHFGARPFTGDGALVQDDELHLRFGGREERFSLQDSPLIGRHNQLNLAAAAIAALAAGGNCDGIRRVIETFSGLEHRLEQVPNGRGVRVLNDSKATTPHATLMDLKAVQERYPQSRVLLLVGGQAKQGSWRELGAALRRGVVIGFGADGGRVVQELRAATSSGVEFVVQDSVASAVQEAIALMDAEDILLFAPGCASFDAYSGFEARGRDFKRLIGELLR